MGAQDEQELKLVFPGRGGLNDETNPLLIGEAESPELENVDFDRRSLRGSLGARKLHRDLPRLAGVRFAARPSRRVAAQAIPAQSPFAVIPFHPEQVEDAGDHLTIEVAFRLGGTALRDTLSGYDQTPDATSVDDPGLVEAPPGGEFQFQPIVQRGGSDLEEMSWVLGIGVLQPEGFKDNAGNATANVQPNKIRPVFAYWDDALQRMRFCVADTHLVPGMEYFLSLVLAQDSGESQWYLNGYAVDQLPAGSGATALPAVSDLDLSYQAAIYLARGMFRETGKYPDAPMFRGIYGLTVTAGGATSVQDASLQVPGALNSSWIDCYVRCLTGVAALNEGCIRRVTAYNDATGTLTCDAFPATLVGETVDIILPIETTPTDITIQELRLWKAKLTQAEVQQLMGKQCVRDIRLTDATSIPDPDEAYLVHAGLDPADLLGYWPLSDDGNSDLQDRSFIGNDGWFASSPLGKSRGLHLDGERLALQRDLSLELEGHLPLRENLGGPAGYNIHCRIVVQLSRDIVDADPGGSNGIEDALYETLFDFDDPSSSEVDPILSLRWTHWKGDRRFYFVWNCGTTQYVIPVNPAYIQPEIGRKLTYLFGLQQAKGGPDHRFYLLSTRGDEARGWSGTHNSVLVGAPDISSPADEGKTRISFGASVVGEPALGSGEKNACLMRLFGAGFALRPMLGYIPLVGAGTIHNPPIDRWTSFDEPLSPHDIEPPISREADTLELTYGSPQATPTGDGWLTNEIGNFPQHYLLRIPASKARWLREDKSPVERPRLVHVLSATSQVLTLSNPWNEQSQSAVEAKVAAYLGYTDLRIADAREVSLNPTPPEEEVWGVQEVFEELGVLGLQDPAFWVLALLPSSSGVPQSAFSPRWDDGLVIGWEKSRGISQLKRGDGKAFWVQAVNGSLYGIRPRWVRDHPFLGQSEATEWCLEFPHIERSEAELLELNQPELLRLDRRTNVYFDEGIRVEDNTSGASPFRLWIPNDLAGNDQWFILRTWLKFESLAGRRTIACRVGMASQAGPPEILVHQVNFHWRIDDGAMVLELADNAAGTYYRLLCGVQAPTITVGRATRAREFLPLNEWFHVGVQLGIDPGSDAFLGGNFFVNGRYIEATVQDGGLVPSAIPAPANVNSGWIAVYGNSDLGQTDPIPAPISVPFAWGLGGRISGFEAEISDHRILYLGNKPVYAEGDE